MIVNRVWGWHFGRPLVTTPSNFGKLGDPPSHPDLLDDLTARFIAGGWSLKALHREIVLSATYRQSSRGVASAASTDPENKWLGRSNRRRLDIEAWRDAILQVSGSMDPTMGGPSGNLEDIGFRRRTVYGRVSRQRVADVLRAFDFPDANRHGEGRDATTTPLQQLYFLNSPFLLAHSDKLAGSKPGAPASERGIRRAPLEGAIWRVAGVRPAKTSKRPRRGASWSSNSSPRSTSRAFIERSCCATRAKSEVGRSIRLVEGEGGTDSLDAWAVLAQALLISNEFLFVD